MRIKLGILCLLWLSVTSSLRAQTDPGAATGREDIIDRALRTSILTHGKTPFHAVLAIGESGSSYTGRVEVWWADAQRYKTSITSPNFNQTRVVNGTAVMESDTGDYYPRWLQNFVDGLLDPIPMAANFRALAEASSDTNVNCLMRNDRPGGITDELTWGQVCFWGGQPLIRSVLTMNEDINLTDFRSFGEQQIAREYSTSVLDYKEVHAHLVTLEELRNPSAETFAVTTPTPADRQIHTEFVSTLKEESLIEVAPKIDWPPVREGRTDGYMIVYARTDRTGQVRETAKHNSDQPGLESFGMEQALRYKFKPLIVDGVAVQMEMPLVLHFTSKVEDPLPTLRGAELLKQIGGCHAKLVQKMPSGKTAIHVSVNEQGKLTGEGFGPKVDPGLPAVVIDGHPGDCRYAPLVRNGVATYYHGDLYAQGLMMQMH